MVIAESQKKDDKGTMVRMVVDSKEAVQAKRQCNTLY